MFRQPVYNEDRLYKGRSRRTRAGSKVPDYECGKRSERRQVYERLSRYYQLEGGRSEWRTTQLLPKGKHGCGY